MYFIAKEKLNSKYITENIKTMDHFVYLLKSLKDFKYYIGSSSNIEKHLAYHNAGKQ
jgi:hypothetical protein